jgi:hypothetical protein
MTKKKTGEKRCGKKVGAKLINGKAKRLEK